MQPAGPQPTTSGSSVPQGGAAPAVEAAKAPPPQGQNATPSADVRPDRADPSGPSAAKAPPVSLQEAEAIAQANDIRGCRDAARKMRLAGVAMPPGLLALAGLRLDLLATAQQ